MEIPSKPNPAGENEATDTPTSNQHTPNQDTAPVTMRPGGSELTWFLKTYRHSWYPENAIQELKSEKSFQDRMQVINTNEDERIYAGQQLMAIEDKTKRIVEHFQGIGGYGHAGNFEFGAEGILDKLRRKLGGLFSGGATPSPKRRSLQDAPYQITRKCKQCHALRANYGKCKFQNLKQSMQGGCELCGIVVAVLGQFCGDIDPDSKIRMFAPFQSGSTLLLLCKDKPEGESKIPFPIDVYVRSGNPSPCASIAQASDITGDTSSALALERVRAWIDLCNESHTQCSSKDQVSLPSRLVQISETETGHSLRLVETEGKKGRYACLSHPWGKNAETVVITTDENYQKHLENVAFGSLSPLFQQAIATAWRLGFHFIWIDSLCIIQKNAEDWDMQACKMESYYRLADLTLAASKAYGPESGCYSVPTPEHLVRAIPWSDKAGNKYTICARRSIPHAHGWPLSTRGWVYQERMLSPRILHFGTHELVWECAHGSMCECGLAMNFSSELSGKLEHHQLYASTPTVEELRDAWRHSVEEYSNLNLTYHKDAMPALAGLARKMHKVRGSRYLAGLWEDSLIGDMLWSTTEPIAFNGQAKARGEKLDGPTWSWSSFETSFEGVVGFNRVSYGYIGETKTASGLEHSKQGFKTIYATVLEANCEPLGADEFGRVAGGEVVLKAPVVTAQVKIVPWGDPPPSEDAGEWERQNYEDHKNRKKYRLKMKDFDTPEGDIDWDIRTFMSSFFPDFALDLPGPRQIEEQAWVKVVQMVFVNKGPNYTPKFEVSLVLREAGMVEGVQKYERIGLAVNGGLFGMIDWFAKAKNEAVHII